MTPREIVVYTPPDYERAIRRRYPVLYLQDGQNLFDPETSFIRGQHWRVAETADRLIRTGAIAPLIIVGIYNAGDRRIDEYTPTVDAGRGRGGKSEAYAAVLLREIKPYIDATFRTRRGPENTGLGGSSLGGILALDFGLRFPHVFGKLAVMSPALWWDRAVMLRRVRERLPLRIWLDMGTAEGEEVVRLARELRDILERFGWREGADLQHWEAPGAGHNELAWAARVEPMLRFLFPLH
jgi:predicted alpha/beta superfamily hydrolase